jgi:prepilin-type N-terminal cleavage/methylation domain-containing protein/prepilin-type processing-associated H-X9-DG protein
MTEDREQRTEVTKAKKILKKNKGPAHRSASEDGFTLVELLVVIAIIALLMAVLLPALTKARRVTKRVVCTSNMKQLVVAWVVYTDNSDGKLVNGGQAIQGPALPGKYGGVKEPFWCTPLCPIAATDEVGTFATERYDWTSSLPYAERLSLLRRGALFKYAPNEKMYRCQEAKDKNVHRTYVMPVSMNAWCSFCGYPGGAESLVAKRIGQIKKSKERIVFFEEKNLTDDAVQFPYSAAGNPTWDPWDKISGNMHESGANFGFADGHSEYRKWESPESIKWLDDEITTAPTCATSVAACRDLKWIFNAIWGESR